VGEQDDPDLRLLPVLGADDVVDVNGLVGVRPLVGQVLGMGIIASLLKLGEQLVPAGELGRRAGHATNTVRSEEFFGHQQRRS